MKLYYTYFFQKKPLPECADSKGPFALSLYFGIPGAGKTTFAAWLAKRDLKARRRVYSNVPITNTLQVDRNDLGRNLLENGRLIWDEAGIDFDNRKMKLSDEEVYFFKYHRHYKMHVDFFSQGLDVDIKIRKLARHLYVVRPSILPFFICRREIARRVGIDDLSKQIIDEYYWKPFGRRLIFSPLLWNMFNTYSRKELPSKAFEKW